MLVLPEGVVALGAGTALALGAAVIVLGPLLRDDDTVVPPRTSVPDDAASVSERASAVDALREIEFDRATGKLSDADYATLKSEYTREALAELRARDAASLHNVAAANVDDAALEATIRSYRSSSLTSQHGVACATCGPRPEPDAVFCSTCGRFLAGHCASCGAACDADGQRFCASCGHSLAA